MNWMNRIPKTLRRGVAIALFMLLMGIIYLVADSCAVSPYPPPAPQNSGRIFGEVWADSTAPSPSFLHLHGSAITLDDTAVPGVRTIAEDSIPLRFFAEGHYDSGRFVLLHFFADFRTKDSDYAAGSWKIDSAFVTDTAGTIWRNAVLAFYLRVPSYRYGKETIDFTH